MLVPLICLECKVKYGEKDFPQYTEEVPAGVASHGYCKKCFPGVMDRIGRYRDEQLCAGAVA